MKAILELEMPENCRECMISFNKDGWVFCQQLIRMIKGPMKLSTCPGEGKRKDCPLKPVEV